jgi:hypothetical protein
MVNRGGYTHCLWDRVTRGDVSIAQLNIELIEMNDGTWKRLEAHTDA